MPDKIDKFAPIARKDDPKLYAMMDELVAAHHSDIAEAKIVLVQEYEVKEDRDGILRWGKAKKVGPLEREFHDHDFIILLNWKVWQELPETARRALLDHELTHCAAAIDDQTGETTYYCRRHDLEEFNEIVGRYGLWRESVKVFVDKALKKDEPTLFDEKKPAGDAPSYRGFCFVKGLVIASLAEDVAHRIVDRFRAAASDEEARQHEDALRAAGWVQPGMELARRDAARYDDTRSPAHRVFDAALEAAVGHGSPKAVDAAADLAKAGKDGTTVSISSGGRSVTFGPGSKKILRGAAKKLRETAAKKGHTISIEVPDGKSASAGA